MTWPEYERAARGYHIREARQWERTREVLLQQANLNRDPKKHPAPFRREQLLPLPTDVLRPARQASGGEGMKEFRERMRREILAKKAKE